MTSVQETDDYFQAFRVLSASTTPPDIDDAIYITSRLDKKTGERIVLWADILTEIKNADRVRNGKRSVSFMVDDDFKVMDPLRIPYCPGVVLDVIVKCQEQEAAVVHKGSAGSHPAVPGSSQSTLNAGSKSNLPPTQESVGFASVVQHVSNLSIATAAAIDKSLARQTALLDSEEEKSLQQYGGKLEGALWRPDTHPHTLSHPSSQNIQIQPVGDFIKERLHRMNKTGVQEGDLFQMHTLSMLQQTLDKQQQTLNRLTVLENRVQALMTQNYELHEYPIPRLFIVLPKWKKRRDKFTHPLSKQFRLHFLCECGEKTIHTGRGSFPNDIHLARHEGYDIDQPNEFFKKYGSYVLAVLKFFKYGAMAAGVAIPPLPLFKVADGLDSMQKSLTSILGNIESLMGETIKYIQELQGDMQNGSDTSGQMRMEDIEALEGADLRQLQLYLHDKDKGRVLGDLFRTFTVDGHVKWVCIDHYKENYRKVAMQRFKDVIAANNGRNHEGAVRINLGSRIVAKQFYEAMIEARGVKRLYVELRWDVTFDDFRTLASDLTKANINSLCLVGDYLKEPIMDMVNNSRRYNPILDLMCNGRIEKMELQGFPDFYQHITLSSMGTGIRLQRLDIRKLNCSYEPHLKAVFMKLLRNCPCLVELYMSASDFKETFEDLKGDVVTLPRLEKMTMERHWGFESIKIGISHGKISTVRANLVFKDNLYSELPFIRRGYLTGLMIRGPTSSRILSDPNASQISDVIYTNPMLEDFAYTGAMDQPRIMMDAITSTREKTISERGAPKLLRVTLDLDYNGTFTTSYEFPECSATPTVSTIVREGCFHYDDARAALQLGWSINILQTDRHFKDEMATDLDKSTEEKGSTISSLSLNPCSLTAAGLECMDRVIDRSRDLQHFNITFDGLYEEHQGEHVERLISRHGKRLNGLMIDGESIHLWIQKLTTCCPSRLALPQLDSFKIGHPFEIRWIPPDCVRWIASMVSTIPQGPSVNLSSQLQQLDFDPATESSRCEWILSGIKQVEIWLDLDPDEWEVVVRALDYSSLNHLSLQGDGFTMDQFKLLVDCVPVNTNPMRELRLFLPSQRLRGHEEWDSQLTRLRSKLQSSQ